MADGEFDFHLGFKEDKDPDMNEHFIPLETYNQGDTDEYASLVGLI